MNMSEFQIKYFSDRLKFIAKEKFGGINKLAAVLGIKNASVYTKENPREPGAGILWKLAKSGVDINWLLLGDKLGDVVKDNQEKYSADTVALKERVTNLEAELMKMKAEMYDLITSYNEKERQIVELEAKNKVLSLNFAKGDKGKSMI